MKFIPVIETRPEQPGLSLFLSLPSEEEINLYTEAFPPEERRPVSKWTRLFSPDPARALFLSIRYNGQKAGFITLWKLSTGFYVEHFAIFPSMRCGGIGSKVLAAIEKAGFNPLILEVEPNDATPEAERRIEFYKRNGFFDFPNFDYLQPPYKDGSPSVRLMLMSTDPLADLPRLSSEIISKVYK